MARKPKVVNPKPRGGKLRNMLSASDWAIYEPPNKDELQIARVYVNYGVESGVNLDGDLIRLTNRRNLPTVAGDLVYTDGKTVEGILPRGKVLTRYADIGGIRLIASHLEQVGLVISASNPPLHEGFVDRYLVYCLIAELPLFIVANKMDEAEDGFLDRLKPFQDAGVDVYPTSCETNEGIDTLMDRLARGITVLSGLSGVGKSTLITLLTGEDIPVQEISGSTGRGRHTTTAAEAYDFADTLLIDSPGVKKFGFMGVKPSQVIKGFPEIATVGQDCVFEDCLHLGETDCAVKQAVERGDIDERRYRAYVDLVNTIEG